MSVMEIERSIRSWFVLFMVTMSLCLEAGIIKGFSVLLPTLKEQLSTSTWVVGSAIGIISAWGYLIGLSANVVVKLIGARYGMMLCGLVSSFGLITCACANNAYTLFAGQILTGFLLLQENLAIGVVPNFFTVRQYNTAASVYSCGAGLGMVLLPPLTQMLLETYGWRGTLLLLGGLCLQSIPFSALLLQPETDGTHKERLICPEDIEANTDHSRSTFQGSNRFETFAKSFGAHLLIRPSFIARVLVPSFAWGYAFSGWIIYIVSFGLSNGVSLQESTIVATCGGLGIVLSRIPLLPLLHTVMTNKPLVYASSVLMAISLILATQFVSFVGMTTLAALFGVSTGILGAELYISAKDVAEKCEYYLTIAWLHMSYGAAAILSGFVSGFLFDMTGNFTISFYVMGAASLMTVVSMGLMDISQILNNQWCISYKAPL